ncbi:TetR/AcrR family transcriptional regulator [Proteiniborus sp. MB09-C3]|uniref:TetR/AcrR family transcriptional regulator n=1 Tax=Proteiniborus sp. MB09-C3 TaxID=3050072 RepID=UPI0025522996|nr:TetR/AcrR family transcriptional regulator [Proteiniborus sp. MB09-C3]WIV13539.1 TetR/AcrR family transcriptional regulator [Proteiniborus sp. MB09-C3]
MKEDIINEVYRLSNTYGLKKLTMSTLASSLKISKKTIYEYFESKDELINEVLDHYIKKNYDSLNHELKESSSIVEQLKIVCFLFIPRPYDFYENNIKEIELYYPEKYSELQKLMKYKTEKLINIYSKGIELGIFEPNINPITIAFISQSFLKTTYNENMLDMNESKIPLFESFYEILLYGCIKR